WLLTAFAKEFERDRDGSEQPPFSEGWPNTRGSGSRQKKKMPGIWLRTTFGNCPLLREQATSIQHIMNSRQTFFLAGICALFVACGKPSTEKNLTGAWEFENPSNSAKVLFNFTADHRFTETITAKGPIPKGVPTSTSGTWNIDKDTLILEHQKTNNLDETGAETSKFKIVALNKGVLVLGTISNDLMTLKRVGHD
ncbi:MAG: lipocalin family protein, partial [Verrucomicrobiales bacterium]|nr:lipocalin family protein [Verrucomicrobiales bacterium]